MKPKIDYSIYLVTDRELMSTISNKEKPLCKGAVTLLERTRE